MNILVPFVLILVAAWDQWLGPCSHLTNPPTPPNQTTLFKHLLFFFSPSCFSGSPHSTVPHPQSPLSRGIPSLTQLIKIWNASERVGWDRVVGGSDWFWELWVLSVTQSGGSSWGIQKKVKELLSLIKSVLVFCHISILYQTIGCSQQLLLEEKYL